MNEEIKQYKVGEIAGHKEIGKLHRGNYIYALCPRCNNNPRWLRLSDYKKKGSSSCEKCKYDVISLTNRGKSRSHKEPHKHKNHIKLSKPRKTLFKNGGYRGSRDKGYWAIILDPSHPFYCMASSEGRVLYHRYIMAEYLGRPLLSKEVVHHKNKDTNDNKIENLELLESKSDHVALHNKLRHLKGGGSVEMS